MGGRQGQKKAQNGKGVFQEGEAVYKRLPFLQKKRSREKNGPPLPLQPAAVATLELEYKDHMSQI